MYAREIYNLDEAISALNTNPTQSRLYQVRDLIRATRLSLVRSQPSDSRLLKAIEILSLAEAQMSSRVNPAVDFFKSAAQAPISPFTSTPRGPWGLQSLESIEAGPPQPLQTQARQQFTDVQNLLIQAKSLILSADTPPILRSNPKSLGYCNVEQLPQGVDIGYQEGEPLVTLMCEGFLPAEFYNKGILRPESFMDALQLFYPDAEIISQFQPVHLIEGGKGSDGLATKTKLPKEKPPTGKYEAVYGDIKMFTGWFFIFEALVLQKGLDFKTTEGVTLDPDFSEAYTLFGSVAAAGATYALTGSMTATGGALAPAAGVFFDDPTNKALAEAGVRAGSAQYDKYQKRQKNKEAELSLAENEQASAITTNGYRVNGYNPTQMGYCESIQPLGVIGTDRLIAGGVAVGALGAIAFTKFALDENAYRKMNAFVKADPNERGIELGFKFLEGHSQFVYWSEVMRMLKPLITAPNNALKVFIKEGLDSGDQYGMPSDYLSKVYGRDFDTIKATDVRAFLKKMVPNSFLFNEFNLLLASVGWLFKNLDTYKYQDLVVRVDPEAKTHEEVSFFQTSKWKPSINLGHGNGYCASMAERATTITRDGKAPTCDDWWGCTLKVTNTVVDLVNPTTWQASWNGINCGEGFEVYDPEHKYSKTGVSHYHYVYRISDSFKDFVEPLNERQGYTIQQKPDGGYEMLRTGDIWVKSPDGSYQSNDTMKDSARIHLGMAQALMAVFLIYGVKPEVLERFKAAGADWVDGLCSFMDTFYSTPEFLARKQAAFKEAQAYLDTRPPKFVNLPFIKESPKGRKLLAFATLAAAGYATYKLSQKKK